MEFSTHRLHFQRLCESDKALFCGLYEDPETMRFIAPPMTPEGAQRAFYTILRKMNREHPDLILFALVDRATQQKSGIASLQQIDQVDRRVEAGLIMHSDYRSRGMAKEGLSALVAHAFATLPVDEVWVRFAADHTVAEKLVIGVGLISRTRIAPANGMVALQIWSARRESWCPVTAINI